MTTEPDLTALALALASAKKPCHICLGTGVLKFSYPDPEVRDYSCIICKETPGEVYVLGPEVRVECPACLGYGKVNSNWPSNVCSESTRHWPCTTCDTRGWNPLDPRYGWDWMMALAEYMVSVSNVINYKRTYWEGAIGEPQPTDSDTPWDAFFQAAMKALSLPTETQEQLDETIV